jgi:hypothetical protein
MERRLSGLEQDRRAFQEALSKAGSRIVIAGILIGALVGTAQLSEQSVVWKGAVAIYRHIVPIPPAPRPPQIFE